MYEVLFLVELKKDEDEEVRARSVELKIKRTQLAGHCIILSRTDPRGMNWLHHTFDNRRVTPRSADGGNRSRRALDCLRCAGAATENARMSSRHLPYARRNRLSTIQMLPFVGASGALLSFENAQKRSALPSSATSQSLDVVASQAWKHRSPIPTVHLPFDSMKPTSPVSITEAGDSSVQKA